MNGLPAPGRADKRRRARNFALCAVLFASPLAAFAAPAIAPPIPCATGNTRMLAGSQAGAGTRFSAAIGVANAVVQ